MSLREGATIASDELPPIAILAGGRGKRLGALTKRIPKPLLPVAGKPFIEHQLLLLRANGARKVVICVGYLGEQFEKVLSDGERFGLALSYASDGPRPAGTAGALRAALEVLGNEFLVLYGDTYLPIDYRSVARAFLASRRLGLMTVLENRGAWDRSNAVYVDGEVVAYDKHDPPQGARWIDYGLLGFRARALRETAASDLAEVTSHLACRGQLAGYLVTERFHEIGTEASLRETERFLQTIGRSRAAD